MKKILYIFLAAVLALTACRQIDPESPLPIEKNADDLKVPIEFNIAVPTDGPSTKAMANDPQIKNIVLAVFGGSGYFNEWVKADASTVYATENETIYKLSAKLSMSESRLRIHIIANCPEQYLDNPPITGVSNEDLEDVVLSKIRSKITEANNDGYWQKIYIPYGIAAQIDPDGNGANAYMTDASGNLIPTTLTINQFKMVSPIPLVRNFARIKLVNNASDVTIQKVGLAFAPAEGVIAPILSTPYRVDEWGARVVEVAGAGHEDEHGWHDGETNVYPVKADRPYGADLPDAPKREDYNDDAAYNAAVEQYNVNVSNLIGGIHVLGHELKNATTNADVLGAQFTGSVYNEDFVTNYQNLPLKAAPTDAEGNTYKLLTDAPYNYAGTAPANLTFAPNPTSNADGTPATGFVEYDPNGYLYVYERPRPRTFSGKTEMATRIIIYATKAGEQPRYYALDILEDGNYIPLLRNFTYTVELQSIASGSGEDTAEQAATTTGSNVSSDPKTQDLNEVSDGTSTIRVSYVDITHIKSGTYDVYYQFIPDVKNHPDVQSNKDVTIDWGYDGGEGGYVAHGVSANGSPFAMTAATEDEPNGVPSNLKIDMTGSEPTLYVPDGNGWKVATTAAEKAVAWSRIEYTTSGEAGSAFDVATFGTIRVTGSRTNATLYRDVRVNVIPKKTMTVRCAQKYVQSIIGQPEDYIIRIPADITRSMFPLEFKIQAEAGSLTPRDGDNLPVTSGKSIVEGKETQSAFYFIKTLTRQEYEALPLITVGSNSYKEFTCKFKTTKAASATKIYASNPYFNLAWDDFANFKQRLFTSNTLGNLSAGQEVTLRLTMDNASHTSDNNNMVFDNATDGYTDSNQVIPHEVKITMVGIQPATNANGQIADENLVASQNEDGVYYYHPAKSGTRPGEYQKDLHLVAEGGEDSYSITFSSATCTNPDLYKEYTVSGNIIKAQITGSGFTNTSGNAITSIRREAGLPVQFRFTYGGTPVPVTFKLQGLTPAADSGVTGPDANGNYTYTPTAARVINFTTTDATTECKLTDFAVPSDYTEMYSQPNPNSFSLNRANARTVTVNSPTIYYNDNAWEQRSWTSDPISITFSEGRRRQEWNYGYSYFTQINDNEYITVTTTNSSTITSITIHYYNNNNTVSASTGTYSESYDKLTGTWSGSAVSVRLNYGRDDSNTYTGISSIEVTYE